MLHRFADLLVRFVTRPFAHRHIFQRHARRQRSCRPTLQEHSPSGFRDFLGRAVVVCEDESANLLVIRLEHPGDLVREFPTDLVRHARVGIVHSQKLNEFLDRVRPFETVIARFELGRSFGNFVSFQKHAAALPFQGIVSTSKRRLTA